MIVKHFKHGARKKLVTKPIKSAKKATGYLLGSNDHAGQKRSVEPVLFKGDPQQFEHIVGYGKQAGVYTSGVLRFEENDISDDTLNDVADSFENFTFPGLDKSQYCSVWVLHKDKGGTELHFLFAGEELTTGNQLKGYVHKIDSGRRTAWRIMTNAHYGFTDPDDPAKAKMLSVDNIKTFASDKKKLIEIINNEVSERVDAGTIRNRADVIEMLKDAGLNVSRETKTRISIENPLGGQNIALKGTAFHQDFEASPETKKQVMERANVFNSEEARAERYTKAKETFDTLYAKRVEYNMKRYGKATTAPVPEPPSPGPKQEEKPDVPEPKKEKKTIEVAGNEIEIEEYFRNRKKMIEIKEQHQKPQQTKEKEMENENRQTNTGILEALRSKAREFVRTYNESIEKLKSSYRKIFRTTEQHYSAYEQRHRERIQYVEEFARENSRARIGPSKIDELNRKASRKVSKKYDSPSLG